MFCKIILIVLGVIVIMKILKELVIKLSNKLEKELFEEAKNKDKKEKQLKEEKEKFIKKVVEDNKNILSEEHKEIIKEIKNLLIENENIRKSVDKIIEMKEIDYNAKREINNQNIYIENSIILLAQKYSEQEVRIGMLELDNNTLNNKVIELERRIFEL